MRLGRNARTEKNTEENIEKLTFCFVSHTETSQRGHRKISRLDNRNYTHLMRNSHSQYNTRTHKRYGHLSGNGQRCTIIGARRDQLKYKWFSWVNPLRKLLSKSKKNCDIIYQLEDTIRPSHRAFLTNFHMLIWFMLYEPSDPSWKKITRHYVMDTETEANIFPVQTRQNYKIETPRLIKRPYKCLQKSKRFRYVSPND